MRILLLLIIFFCDCCYASTQNDNQIQKVLEDFLIKSNAPAASLSINFPDNTISNFVSGTLEKKTLKNPNPPLVTADSLFQIGSITKSFTAAIILQLEAEGKLSINHTIEDITKQYGPWLSKEEYQAWKNISIKQLLNMTSGVFDVIEDKNFLDILAKHPEKNWTAQEIIAYSLKHQPYFSPGKGWYYSNTAYNILGILIEAVTKHSFEYEINQRILKKYSLKHTYYLPYEYPQNIIKKMAHGYVYAGGEFSPPMKSGSDMTFFNMSAAGPSGALVSTSADITRWVRLLFTGKILPEPQLTEMLSAVCMGADHSCRPGEPLAANSHSQAFSLGLSRMYDPQLGVIWIYVGSTSGYYSALIWLPNKKIALALTVSAATQESKKILRTLVNIAKLI